MSGLLQNHIQNGSAPAGGGEYSSTETGKNCCRKIMLFSRAGKNEKGLYKMTMDLEDTVKKSLKNQYFIEIFASKFKC